MKLAYFRKSNLGLQEIKEGFRIAAAAKGVKVLEAEMFPSGSGFIMPVIMTDWAEEAAKGLDPNLFNFIPFAFYAYTANGGVFVGSADPKAIAPMVGHNHNHDHDHHDCNGDHGGSIKLTEASNIIRAIIDEAAGIGEKKIKNVKLYSTMTCPYCRMEKEWLEKTGVKFDYVLVDMNQAAGEDLVRKTGQTAVPVTEIEYEEGGAEFIVGFDKEELSGLLGIK